MITTRVRRQVSWLAGLLAVTVLAAGMGADTSRTWSGSPRSQQFDTLQALVPGLKWALNPADPMVQRVMRTSASADEVLARLIRFHDSLRRTPDSLWITQTDDAEPGDIRAWASSRSIQLADLPPWVVPASPDWSANPYGSASWAFRFHSLGWLVAVARAGDWSDVVDLLLAWIRANPPTGPDATVTWYDHATAFRADAVVELYEEGLRPQLTPSQNGEILVSMWQHGSRLRAYLDEDRFFAHNHNIFHALSLYNLARSFPELKGASEWSTAARARLSTLLPEMVDIADGVSREQSADYHFLELQLYLHADRFLRQAGGDGLTDQERGVLRQMARFGALLSNPDATVPAIGDTVQPAPFPASLYAELGRAGLLDEETRFLVSRGAEGIRPPDAAFYPDEGYDVMRPVYTVGPGWTQDPHVVVDMGPPRWLHGHDDAMSVLAAAGGRQLLIDSGGPYQYGEASSAAFVAARAHNTVVVDGIESRAQAPTVTTSGDEAGASWIQGEIVAAPGVRHRRTVLMVKPFTLVIVDELESTAGEHRVDAYWHLPPGTQTETGAAGFAATVDGTVRLQASIVASGPTRINVVSGRDGPLPLGWTTPRQQARLAAPVVDVQLTDGDAWMVTAFALPGAYPARVHVERLPAGFVLGLAGEDDGGWLISPGEVRRQFQ